MTLIVAGISEGSVWMVGDTAISDRRLTAREREYQVKVLASPRYHALVGFAGAAEYGAAISQEAMIALSVRDAISTLEKGSLIADVDFAYAYIEDNNPKLLRISKGRSESVAALYIGEKGAFELFQAAKLGATDMYASKALKTFIVSTKSGVLPDQLAEAIIALTDVIMSRQERDIGGWATPYTLNASGPYFIEYCYSVSDPIFDRIAPGSVVPHGSTAEGGTTLSVTEIGNNEGIVVYWLQLPGGVVLVKNNGSYTLHRIKGTPEFFRQAVKETLDLEIELWVGEASVSTVKRLIISRDELGNINTVTADHGGSYSIAAHNTYSKFQIKAELMANPETEDNPPKGIVVECLDTELVEIAIGEAKIALTADQLSKLMLMLAEARCKLVPEIPRELGGKTLAQSDPAWRTSGTLHPSLEGLTLSLRHSGYGWMTFVLPHGEAKALGKWLYEAAQT